MSKFIYILDPGHGGMIEGKYQTAGKRSPLFDDGKTILYEGVNNRDNVNRIIAKLEAKGIMCVDIVNSEHDISLPKRVEDANRIERPSIYISIHSDAACNTGWKEAKGITVYTSPGQTKSDEFANVVIAELEKQFGNGVKFRQQRADGDKDYEADFYVLRKTKMPAILIEGGFHTDKEEAARMLTDEWKDKLTDSIVFAIEAWEKLHT